MAVKTEYSPAMDLEEENLEKRISNRKLLLENEPVVYRILNQALKERKISHAYLFSGPKGCLKKEAGILFAQSLFCESDELIIEENLDESKKAIARRCASGNYSDFLFFDGHRKEAVGKDDVSEIQSLFSKTSSEVSLRKVYLIDHIENMSIAAMNALLKFLEEPAENVYAILTVDNIERILPTIISRCVLVPFHPLARHVYESLALQEGLDAEDAFLLTGVVNQTSGYMDLAASTSYQTAKTMLKQYIGVKGNPRLLLVDYDVRYRTQVKDSDGSAKEKNLEMLTLFFKMLAMFYRYVLNNKKVEIDWYQQALEDSRKMYTKEIYIKLLEVVREELDLCNRNNDLNLVLDQAIYQMEAITNGRRNNR